VTPSSIRIERVSKVYRIGRLVERHDTLRDAVAAGVGQAVQAALAVARPGRKARLASGPGDGSSLWALKDVSLDVAPGEVLGIIGRNGAGKSTLLKILSCITEPTEGRVELQGRIGSLLEVGTGFHPELTGRENIYLNGAILGMRRQEIERKYDEIVAFAEIEKFLETPVKRFSSGMYVRLAFAVAAHLEPEILLVDEVLAVGDAAFQKKCLGKMDDVARGGRTILFVSHNMNAIQRLCPRVVWLHQGHVEADGRASDTIARYLSSADPTSPAEMWIPLTGPDRSGTQQASFESVMYSSLDPSTGFQPYPGGSLVVSTRIRSDRGRAVGSLAVTLYDQYGTKLVNADTLALGRTIDLRPGVTTVRLRIESLNLNPGTYVLGLWMANPTGEVFDSVPSVLRLEVVDHAEQGLGVRPKSDGLVTCEFDVMEGE
jgi:ABC-type polysaccharide/polyol phosphate transport system ATPase subunit